MANNLIQIRRSNASATPGTTLLGGELAYSYNSNNLFVGAQTGVGTAATKIGGAKFGYVDNSTAGVLTANAAKITDANAFISNTFTTGLFIASSIASPTANSTAALITSISPAYITGQLGATTDGSNTELATTWAIKSYIDNKTAAATTNVAAQYNWTNTHSFSANITLTNTASLVLSQNTGINANGTFGTAGQALLSNGTAVYWGSPTGLFSNGTAYTFSAVETFNANVVLTSGNTTNYLQVGTTATNVSINASSITLSPTSNLFIGNATVNATVFANTTNVYFTGVSATANNASNLGGQLPAFYTNATNITTGTLPVARLPANLVFWSNSNIYTGVQTFSANVTLVGNSLSVLSIGNTTTNTVISATSLIAQSNAAKFGTAFQVFANGFVEIGGNTAPSNTFSIDGSTFIRDKLQVGPSSAFDFGALALGEFDGNANTYSQIVMTNGNSGISASADFVITADTGTDTINYLDIGINSSGYNQAAYDIGGALDAYIYSSNSHLSLGTASVKDIVFHAGGTTAADRKLTINTVSVAFANSVGIVANGSIGTTGQILASNGSGLYWSNPSAVFSNGTAYTWSAIQTFNANSNFTANVNVTGATIAIGNTATGNSTVNTTSHAVFANNGGVSNTISTTQITSVGFSAGASSINATANVTSLSAVVNTSTIILASNVLVGNVSTAANNLFANTSALTLGNTTVNTSLTTALLTVPAVTATAGANIGSQVLISNTLVNFGTIANVYAASANATFNNMSISGNLTVTGTLTTIDTTNSQLKDNIILLSDGNITSDSVDFGFVGQANSGLAGTLSYYGITRIASANAFQLFATNTAPSATTVSGQTVMPLQAYLQPYGSGGAFIVNSTAVSAVANATVSVNITANTLSITSGLGATSGGTGRTTAFTAGDVFFASNTTYMSNLAIAANGYVLQVTNNLPAWGTLDGGTF